MIRTFIAAELDPKLKKALATMQDSLKQALHRLAPAGRVQWVRVESIHLTLKFLGDIEETQVENILQLLREAARDRAPFSVQVEGLGVFPDLRVPRVLWVGLSGDAKRLIQLAHSIDTTLAPLGLLPEPKPYSPHLTLARVKEGALNIGKALVDSGVMRESQLMGKLSIDAVALIKSQLTPSGSIYSRLGQIPLGQDRSS